MVKNLAGEFRDFLLKQNALALAVGVVIGAAFGRIVSGLVDDFIMPIVGLVSPGGDWRQVKLGPFLVGDFAGRLLDFVIVAAVVFAIVKAFLREAKPAPAPTQTCPQCLEVLPAAATRCRACAQPVAGGPTALAR
ncbi:large conductance mechanosensitive channel protein MscL [Anaeromyxobacter diazotrophicus]|uniref:Large-conductance mechanosensitive channel n=1 Tax=Anaeromyxobacter diazotrophicus TaxID=2590199 RepID=A0A7I9VRV6_9BACT|nr:MscL family protein [Anaeromyxobacter diazotrophicus]GEJ58799.1 large-conductance mechanosensitive channel [Anaeromyxobacter diazotrophicus]